MNLFVSFTKQGVSILDTPVQKCGITNCLGEGGISQSCFGTEIAQMKLKNAVYSV